MNGMKVIAEQTKLLAAKNVKLHLRSRVSTATQLLIGVVFLVLVRLMEVAINMNVNIKAQDVPEPSTTALGALRACDATVRGGSGTCYALAFAPDDGSALGAYATGIVEDVLATAGLPAIGAAGGAIGFADAVEMREWIYANPAAVDVGVVFRDSPSGTRHRVAYSLQANWTLQCKVLKFMDCNDPKRELVLPAQLAIDSAVLREATGSADAAIAASAGNFPHPRIVREEVWDVVASCKTLTPPAANPA